MFSTFTSDDPYNHHHRRNRYNTDADNYNCGGFALGTYSWYMPYGKYERGEIQKAWHDIQSIHYDLDRYGENEFFNWDYYFSRIEHLTRLFTNRILDDFPNCRVIDELEDAAPDETIILFRTGEDDFHFVVSFDHKHWFHKYGWDEIEELCEYEVFEQDWDNGRYNGRIVKFAMGEE